MILYHQQRRTWTNSRHAPRLSPRFCPRLGGDSRFWPLLSNTDLVAATVLGQVKRVICHLQQGICGQGAAQFGTGQSRTERDSKVFSVDVEIDLP